LLAQKEQVQDKKTESIKHHRYFFLKSVHQFYKLYEDITAQQFYFKW